MGSFGGYYKGDKKKPKKGKIQKQSFSNTPEFRLPEIVPKKRRDQF